MRLLVTGGTGFTTICLGSVTDSEVLREITPGHDVIFHVAAAFSDVSAPRSVYWNVNVDGTVACWRQRRRPGCGRWYTAAHRAFEIDRARNELGYEPEIGLAEGLKRTGRRYEENGYI